MVGVKRGGKPRDWGESKELDWHKTEIERKRVVMATADRTVLGDNGERVEGTGDGDWRKGARQRERDKAGQQATGSLLMWMARVNMSQQHSNSSLRRIIYPKLNRPTRTGWSVPHNVLSGLSRHISTPAVTKPFIFLTLERLVSVSSHQTSTYISWCNKPKYCWRGIAHWRMSNV